ncbi:hypothetical protein COLO4_01199, partial [Corchorus olitorius]
MPDGAPRKIIVVQHKIEHHNTQDIREGAFVGNKFSLTGVRQVSHARNGNGTADYRQRHGIQQPPVKIAVSNGQGCRHGEGRSQQNSRSRRQRLPDQLAFLSVQLQFHGSFQHNENQPDRPQNG